MTIETEYQNWKSIIKKYNFDNEEKALEIAEYLTKSKIVSPKEFATLFITSESEAELFLRFIEKGIRFKEKASIQ